MVVDKWCYLIDFDNFNDLVIFLMSREIKRSLTILHSRGSESARPTRSSVSFFTPHCGADQTLKSVQYTTATHSKFHVHRQPSVKPPRDLPAIFNASAFKELDRGGGLFNR